MSRRAFEQHYLPLFWNRQRHQWENYVNRAGHDLSEDDARIYECVTTLGVGRELPGREGQILKAIVSRERVDKHPEVATVRNRLDDAYAQRIVAGTPESAVEEGLRLSRAMKPDVLALMEVREDLARDAGFASYVELVLSSEDLELAPLIAMLKRYVEDNLTSARDLVATYGIALPSWYADLSKLSRGMTASDPVELLSEFLGRIGLDEFQGCVRAVCREQGLAGYAGLLSVPDDIRILVRPVRSLKAWLTFFHELGHAIAHASNREAGLFTTWTTSYDEAMAMVVEHMAVSVFANTVDENKARELLLLEGIECALSALFELALWQAPNDAERLYVEHYERVGVRVEYPEMWAADSFRSLDPVYKHNYVLGAVIAEKTFAFLEREYGSDFASWGPWLVANYFADGRRRSLREKVCVVGGLD